MNLEPLREALLADARAECTKLLDEADARGRAIVAAAESEARALVAAARAEGAAAAEVAAGRCVADARRRARAEVLGGRRTLFEELCAAADAEAEALRRTPAHDALVGRLTGLARSQLGPGVRIEADPAGGIRAASNGRSVDYRLPTLVRRVLAAADARTLELWS